MPTKQQGFRMPTAKEIGKKLKGLINQGIAKVTDNGGIPGKELNNLKKVAEITGVKGNIPFDPSKITSKIPGALEKLPAYDSFESFKNNVINDNREDITRSPSTAGRDLSDPKVLPTWDPGDDATTFNLGGGLWPETEEQRCIRISKEYDEKARKVPDGGYRSREVLGDEHIRCGAVNNTNPAVRVNPKGGLTLAGLVHGDNGPVNRFEECSLVERTGNDVFPCGNLTISCGNKFDVTTATGGINLQTAGITNINGVATTLRGLHMMDIGTAGNMTLGAGQALNISAKSLSLNQSEGGQMAVGGSMGVENQLTVGGSASINGELFCQHITGPASMQVTEQTAEVHGWTNSGEAVAYIPEGRTIGRLTPELCRLICELGGAQGLGEMGAADSYVKVPAFNDENPFKLGVPPEYIYDESSNTFVEREQTGHLNNERKESVLGDLPPHELDGKANLWAGDGSGAVPLQGTDRLGITLEQHAHQFKNIAMSLRSSPSDVTKEAGLLDKFAQVPGIAKAPRAGKVPVGAMDENGFISPNTDAIMAHMQSRKEQFDKLLS
jgi:hypothetical protein